MKRSKISHKLAAAATVAFSTGMVSDAFASTTTLGDVVSNVSTTAGAIPRFLGLLGYIGGAGLAMAGILKLKAHVDNPGQTKITEGLGRLGAGGLLFCLPLVTAAIQGSISNGGAYNADTNAMIIMDTNSFSAAP